MVQSELSKLGYKFAAGDAQLALQQAAIVAGAPHRHRGESGRRERQSTTADSQWSLLTNLGV